MEERYDRLENKLLSDGWITAQQYARVKEEQGNSDKSVYSIIIRNGYLTEEEVFTFLAQCANIPFVRISDYKIDQQLLGLFAEQFYRDNLFLPLFKIDQVLYVAMANPLDSDLLNTLTLQGGTEIVSLFTTPQAILEALDRYFGPDSKYFALEELITAPRLLSLMPPTRESERLSISVPIEFKPIDSKIALISSTFISGVTANLSSSGKALGIRTFIFLPSGIKLLLKFPQIDPGYTAEAEIIRCSMEQGGRYLLGLKFLAIKPEITQVLLAQATPEA